MCIPIEWRHTFRCGGLGYHIPTKRIMSASGVSIGVGLGGSAHRVGRTMTMQRRIEKPGTYPSLFGRRDEDAESEEENDADAEIGQSDQSKVPATAPATPAPTAVTAHRVGRARDTREADEGDDDDDLRALLTLTTNVVAVGILLRDVQELKVKRRRMVMKPARVPEQSVWALMLSAGYVELFFMSFLYVSMYFICIRRRLHRHHYTPGSRQRRLFQRRFRLTPEQFDGKVAFVKAQNWWDKQPYTCAGKASSPVELLLLGIMANKTSVCLLGMKPALHVMLTHSVDDSCPD